MADWIRTHYCGDLRSADVGKTVSLNGWVHRQRNHKGVIFVDLRDCSGLTQVVFDPEGGGSGCAQAGELRGEYVVMVKGKVRRRPEGYLNPSLPTGEVEVVAEELEILNQAKTPPIYIDDRVETVEETLRLRYRYLDLRRPELQKNLIIRHRTAKSIRDFLDREGFLEIETPMLTRSTPEGARDYLVPSRVNPGRFYALPQSPQLFKQILMVSGVDKYYQIVKCFRDEDLRADRQPEFTQIDLEMAFVKRENILSLLEGMMAVLFKELKGIELSRPFPRLDYETAMARFGSDKPDTRFGMELVDLSETVAESEFGVFRKVLEDGGKVIAITASGCGGYTRKRLDELSSLAEKHGAKGVAYLALADEQVKSPIAKFFTPGQLERVIAEMRAREGDLILMIADEPTTARTAMGGLRLEFGRRLDLIPKERYDFLWVIDFPLFEVNTETGGLDAMHHPFTSPLPDQMRLLKEDPAKVKADSYDLVLNGMELGSGSIRIYQRSIQQEIFKILGLSAEEIEEKFGFLLEAFEYGAPPHGGIALGLDRLVTILAGAANMKEVIAFPKTTSAACLMTGAPTQVDTKQLQEAHIALLGPKN